MSGYPLLDVFWTMFLFFCWVLWIFLVVWILIDIFRSRDISGWGKAGWILLVILLPFFGVVTYEIVHATTCSARAAGIRPMRRPRTRHTGPTAAATATPSSSRNSPTCTTAACSATRSSSGERKGSCGKPHHAAFPPRAGREIAASDEPGLRYYRTRSLPPETQSAQSATTSLAMISSDQNG